MAVTQEEIAQRVGVSRRLVGYALSGQANLNPETRLLIQETAASMGYRPNKVAQALASGRTNQIALCFPFLGSSFYNEITRQMEMLLRRTPYSLLIVTHHPHENRGALDITVDGMFYVAPSLCVPKSFSSPVVVMQNRLRLEDSGQQDVLDYDRIVFDTEQASFDAVNHLLAQGYRRVAYVVPLDMVTEMDLRYHAYKTVMERAGLEIETICLPIAAEELIRQKSHRLLTEYFREHGCPEALFCCNDDLGIGAYRALHDLGKRVPEDTAILGFDDLDDAQYLVPPMSSVRMPIAQVCARAWELMQYRIEHPDDPPRHESIKTQLVVRGSTGGPASPHTLQPSFKEST